MAGHAGYSTATAVIQQLCRNKNKIPFGHIYIM